MNRIVKSVALVAVLAASACGSEDPGGVVAGNGGSASPSTSTSTNTSEPGVDASGEDPVGAPTPEAPPPVEVRFDGGSVELRPWTYCYGNGCADGTPPEDPPDVGTTDAVTVGFPLPDWSFEASFREVGATCPRNFTTPLTGGGHGTFTLLPAGYAGTYDVTLFGRGAGGGDLFVTFRGRRRPTGRCPSRKRPWPSWPVTTGRSTATASS